MPQVVGPAGEWFLAGTEPAALNVDVDAAAAPAHAIQSPADGMVMVLDPDIPLSVQRLHFEATGATGRWWLNGRYLGANAKMSWLPRPGRHLLEWRAPPGPQGPHGQLGTLGNTVAQVQFEVRAAGAPTARAARPLPPLKHSRG